MTGSSVKEISDLEEPSNLTELVRFLGLMNVFSDFIPGLSFRVRPLYEVLIVTGFIRKKNKKKDMCGIGLVIKMGQKIIGGTEKFKSRNVEPSHISPE